MADIDEINRLKRLCEEYGLEGREILAKHTDEELARLFNGIGPEAFPGWLRVALDSLHPSLAPVAFIHDVEWSESDGTRETFAESNARFRRNGIKVACAAFGWWRPRRYKVMKGCGEVRAHLSAFRLVGVARALRGSAGRR